MAKYVTTAGCGHTVSMYLYGPESERAHEIAWMRSEAGRCNLCHKKGPDDLPDDAGRYLVRRWRAHHIRALDALAEGITAHT